MSNYINCVKEFHENFNHPINNYKDDIVLKLRQLRIKLLFEELEELSLATDTMNTFSKLCLNFLNKNNQNIDGDNVNKKEEIDALADIQYVLSGAILSLGYQDIFDDAFNEVHRSNMSKMCKNLIEVESTQNLYKEKGIESSFIKKDNGYIIIRNEDNKILKSINYSEANLYKFLK